MKTVKPLNPCPWSNFCLNIHLGKMASRKLLNFGNIHLLSLRRVFHIGRKKQVYVFNGWNVSCDTLWDGGWGVHLADLGEHFCLFCVYTTVCTTLLLIAHYHRTFYEPEASIIFTNVKGNNLSKMDVLISGPRVSEAIKSCGALWNNILWIVLFLLPDLLGVLSSLSVILFS